MDIFTVIIGSILALFVLYVIMRMSYVIMRNVIVGMEFRNKLARKVDALRLNKMLAALGIDINSYLHSERKLLPVNLLTSPDPQAPSPLRLYFMYGHAK